jgi:hypothetical protein
MLLDGFRIDCHDTPFCDLRRNGAIHVRNCYVFNYNSGTGGSNSIHGADSSVLIEQCTFEGRSGAAGPRNLGNALDLRGDCSLYVRQTQFIDNEEILGASFPCVFDGCIAITADATARLNQLSGSVILLRDSPSLATRGATFATFAVATDEKTFIDAATGASPAPDSRSQQLIATLMLNRRLPYWIGLLRHENSELRTIAAAHLARLTGMEVSASPPEPSGETNDLGELGPVIRAEVEFARMMDWFDANKARLQWDVSAGRYRVQGE